jgi:hypothetical protein
MAKRAKRPKNPKDIFEPPASGKSPIILTDGETVRYPRGWKQEDADVWRRMCQLFPG